MIAVEENIIYKKNKYIKYLSGVEIFFRKKDVIP